MLDAVTAVLSADSVRPICDTVNVLAPVAVPYTIEVAVTAKTGADVDTMMAEARAAARAYATAQRRQLGSDVVPAQIISALMVDGVYSLTVTAPAAVVVVDDNQWADCDPESETDVLVTFAGYEGGF